MNWLAHTLLSQKYIDYQLGNILADPLKGKAWPGANEKIVQGMTMHKSIDKFTDQHELITHSKYRLGAAGHLKGVVLDLVFDHFLSINWEQFCSQDLNEYVAEFNQNAQFAAQNYPARPKHIVTRLVESNLLGRYRTFEDLVTALKRIDIRLSNRAKSRETASQYIEVVLTEYQGLQQDFLAFFPELMAYFKTHRLGSPDNHYLR